LGAAPTAKLSRPSLLSTARTCLLFRTIILSMDAVINLKEHLEGEYLTIAQCPWLFRSREAINSLTIVEDSYLEVLERILK